MSFSPLIDHLVESFRCLPGVGPKSAQRMALHILERNREGGLKLSAALQSAVEEVRNCQQCRTLCETEVCRLCGNPQRDRQQICIVETPTDVLAVEQSGTYSGLYFVLMGHLSPIDGIGPAELGIDLLVRRVREEGIRELIMATNPTVEGEATAHYIAEQLRDSDVAITRIAHGVPMGGELEFVDGSTLAHAFQGRRALTD